METMASWLVESYIKEVQILIESFLMIDSSDILLLTNYLLSKDSTDRGNLDLIFKITDNSSYYIVDHYTEKRRNTEYLYNLDKLSASNSFCRKISKLEELGHQRIIINSILAYEVALPVLQRQLTFMKPELTKISLSDVIKTWKVLEGLKFLPETIIATYKIPSLLECI